MNKISSLATEKYVRLTFSVYPELRLKKYSMS